jgi:hypothetical protein
MIGRAAIDFAAGRSRLFIGGLSAGGAILPYGCAASVQPIRDYSLKPLIFRDAGASLAPTGRKVGAVGHLNQAVPIDMVMTWRPAPMRPLRSRALPSASQTGRCKTSMTGEKPVWERNSDPPMRSCAHEQRQRARRSSSFLRPVGQRRLRGLDEDGMGTAQQRAMQADALIHGWRRWLH